MDDQAPTGLSWKVSVAGRPRVTDLCVFGESLAKQDGLPEGMCLVLLTLKTGSVKSRTCPNT